MAKPELFLEQTVRDKYGRSIDRTPVSVPVTPDGGYNGNGQYKKIKEGHMQIIGFDKLSGDWYGRGYIEKEKVET